jgi:negative regulator of sigma E activity
MPRSLIGVAVAALVVLATVYVFNRFSGKNIADLGKA